MLNFFKFKTWQLIICRWNATPRRSRRRPACRGPTTSHRSWELQTYSGAADCQLDGRARRGKEDTSYPAGGDRPTVETSGWL